MVLVLAGEFLMGSEGGHSNAKPPHQVYLDTFYIDTYEVSNVLYQRFMQATGRQAPAYWHNVQYNLPNQPVVGVTWHDAAAYCQWADKGLPTEAEWEKAARGMDGRRYPWGNRWGPAKANTAIGELGGPTPIGSYKAGKSPYGAYDMTENVWEWVADWYGDNYYQTSPRRNPQGPETGGARVVRGGSWNIGLTSAFQCAYRIYLNLTDRSHSLGFRCARTP